jgi:alginate O-acetyltransferase complex protein AlgI
MAPRFLTKIWPPKFLYALLTFFLINVTWVFFRATDFTSAWRLLSSMFGQVTNGAALLSTLSILKVSIITVLLVGCHWLMRNTRVLTVANKTPWWLLGIVWAIILILLMLSQESTGSFIYFQF